MTLHGRIGRAAAVAAVLAAIAAGGAAAQSAQPLLRLPDGPYVDSVPGARAEIWAVGDGADGSAGADGVVELIESAGPDRFLYLGDVYNSGTAAEFERNYAPSWGRLAPITAPTLGNHEAANAATGYDAYWAQALGEPPPSFYAFRAAGWQVLSLNSEVDHGPGSAQQTWLRRKTRGSGNCRIAFWHRPRHTASTHGDATDMAPVWELLRGRARLAISGHEHNMQRFAPRGGIVQLVSGAGGRAPYPIDRADPGLRFADDEHDGALRLRLREGRAKAAFVGIGGEVLDSSTVRCDR